MHTMDAIFPSDREGGAYFAVFCRAVFGEPPKVTIEIFSPFRTFWNSIEGLLRVAGRQQVQLAQLLAGNFLGPVARNNCIDGETLRNRNSASTSTDHVVGVLEAQVVHFLGQAALPLCFCQFPLFARKLLRS